MPPMRGSSHRRTFLGWLAAGTAAFGAALAGSALPLQAMSPREEFKPARHPQDDWMDEIPGKHRLFLDAVTAYGAAEALSFASNYALANKEGYGLAVPELAILICYRHFATPFAFSDDAWAKYGAAWSAVLGYKDPATGGKADDIYQELKRGTVAGKAQFVPAGIVAVGRAQERGYAFSYVG